MPNGKTLALLLLLSISLTACAALDSRERLSRQLSAHPARSAATWSGWRDKALRDKVGPAPELLVDYLRLDNTINGYDQLPQSAPAGQGFADELLAAVEAMPPAVKAQLREYVLGIFLVTDLGSSAYTEVLRDGAPHPQGFIVLDVQALQRTANGWATWREGTPFRPATGMECRLLIEPAAQDLGRNAIAYVILHELGHLVGVATGAHDNWWEQGDPAGYPFSAISWRRGKKGGVTSHWDKGFPERARLRFYADAEAQLPGDQRLDIYSKLARTDFVSLYAATGSYEDFAETYAMYVHVVLQGRPWQLTVLGAGKPLLIMTAPILQPRCAAKRRFMAGLLARGAS